MKIHVIRRADLIKDRDGRKKNYGIDLEADSGGESVRRYEKLTMIKIGCPCVTLVSCTTDVINAPFHTPVASRCYRKGVFYDTDGFQSSF